MLSFIYESYQSDITLDDISRHIHIYKGKCYRVFKDYMRESPFECLLKYRIKKGIPDVLEGKLTMTKTTLRTSFTDSNYSSKVFHKVKGCSLRAYRKARSSTWPS